MMCVRCGSEYTRMAGVQRFKRDYGYCSLDCLTRDKAPCLGCGGVLELAVGEPLARFQKRRYCSHACGRRHPNQRPRSEETKARMSAAQRKRPRRGGAPLDARRRTLLREGQRKWQSNPEAQAARAERYVATMRARGHYDPERQRAFYQSPDGEATKDRIRQKLTGTRRPVRVVEKVRASLRAFYTTPEGIALLEAASARRTHGYPNVPYGPGWSKQATKARSRDGHRCVVCGVPQNACGRVLDVHHIYARRMFGYVPGQNANYRWANHLANLATLCQACHMKVEQGSATLPVAYQTRADALWHEFLHP